MWTTRGVGGGFLSPFNSLVLSTHLLGLARIRAPNSDADFVFTATHPHKFVAVICVRKPMKYSI